MTTQRGRAKIKDRTALEIVVKNEMQRRNLTYASLAALLTNEGHAITGAALYMRTTRPEPTTGTIDLIAGGLGMESGVLFERMREEVKQARSDSRPLLGDGKVKGSWALA